MTEPDPAIEPCEETLDGMHKWTTAHGSDYVYCQWCAASHPQTTHVASATERRVR